jgi:hypothetical protein
MVAAALMAVAACTQQSPDAPSPAPQSPAAATVTLIISTQPQSQTIASGGHVTLSVFAGGNGSLRSVGVGASGNTARRSRRDDAEPRRPR